MPDTLSFEIKSQWDGKTIDHEPIKIEIMKKNEQIIELNVSAPLFNDPQAPNGPPGQPFPELWNYEVIEAFFLGEDDKYLEVELCPSGDRLQKYLLQDQLPLVYQSSKSDGSWSGIAEIPVGYFPSKVNKFNAYAIHGSDPERIYEALYPAPEGKHSDADFHRLEYFKPINLQEHLPEECQKSEVWKAPSVRIRTDERVYAIAVKSLLQERR